MASDCRVVFDPSGSEPMTPLVLHPIDELASWVQQAREQHPKLSAPEQQRLRDVTAASSRVMPSTHELTEPDGVFQEQEVKWWPFGGLGRYAPSRRWHVAWGEELDGRRDSDCPVLR